MPGQLARWDARAYATLVDIAIAAGVLTAWQMTLVVLGPLWSTVAWFAGGKGTAVMDWFTVLSLGQRLIGVTVVDAETRQPVGPARSLVRSLTHILDVLPQWLGMIRPAWNPVRQTWADKIHKTVAIEVARPAQIE